MSLCRIWIVRYSRFCPRTSRCSFFTIVPAPWCGYTTLSPTLYKRIPFLAAEIAMKTGRQWVSAGARAGIVPQNRWKTAYLPRGKAVREKALLRAGLAWKRARNGVRSSGSTRGASELEVALDEVVLLKATE